jgi:hypothetical protein
MDSLTLPAYVLVLRAILPRPETVLIASPSGGLRQPRPRQNGFLTALTGGALLLLDRRPIVAASSSGSSRTSRSSASHSLVSRHRPLDNLCRSVRP